MWCRFLDWRFGCRCDDDRLLDRRVGNQRLRNRSFRNCRHDGRRLDHRRRCRRRLGRHDGRCRHQLDFRYVVGRGREISSDCLGLDVVDRLVDAIRGLRSRGVDVGAVVCGKRSAYIERRDAPFRAEIAKYYTRLEVVDDLRAVTDDEVLKVAVFTSGSSADDVAPGLAAFCATHQVVVSGEHWVDVMNPTANKGTGIAHLQAALGITRSQTMVFGDFLNDLEMMDTAKYSFAMDNAHPELRARARYVAPANSENGVVRTISAALGLSWT